MSSAGPRHAARQGRAVERGRVERMGLRLQRHGLIEQAVDRVRPALAQGGAQIVNLERHPEHFDRLAREHSDCASSGEGGRLGQITEGETTPEFEAALKGLQPGQMTTRPVETRYGFHIIRLDCKLAGTNPDFEAARPLVEEFPRDARWRRAVAQLVSLVLSETRIEGVEIDGPIPAPV